MPIAIHVEVAARELDSKLLLGLLAASRGHDALVGDVIMLSELGLLPNSVFHTKNISPSPKILSRHERIKKAGMKITSLDEEGPGVEFGLPESFISRFGSASLAQVEFVMCWGPDDYKTLTERFPAFRDRFIQTGSPRADLWEPRLEKYWAHSPSISAAPYILVSSNMGIQRDHPGSFFTDPENQSFDRQHLVERLEITSQKYQALASFTQAIEYLSKNLENVRIVVRPHPVEDERVWERLLKDLPGVSVIRDGAVTDWLLGAAALVHNGCTTAIEATISMKKVINFTPFDQKYLRFSNNLGTTTRNLEELEVAVRAAIESSFEDKTKAPEASDKRLVAHKLFRKNHELASHRIVSVWDSMSERSRIPRFVLEFSKTLLAVKNMRDLLYFFFHKQKRLRVAETRAKFPALDRDDVLSRIERLKAVLGIEAAISVTFLGSRTLLIRSAR